MKLEVGVKAILRNPDDKLLFLRRHSDRQGEGEAAWDIPGGRIRVGEPLLVALRREIFEETGLTPQGHPHLIDAHDILDSRSRHVVRLTYHLVADGEVKLEPTEHTEFLWCPAHEVSQLDSRGGLNKYVLKTLQIMPSNTIDSPASDDHAARPWNAQ